MRDELCKSTGQPQSELTTQQDDMLGIGLAMHGMSEDELYQPRQHVSCFLHPPQKAGCFTGVFPQSQQWSKTAYPYSQILMTQLAQTTVYLCHCALLWTVCGAGWCGSGWLSQSTSCRAIPGGLIVPQPLGLSTVNDC